MVSVIEHNSGKIAQNCDEKVKPLCQVFGQCGGCFYQDIPYARELEIKEKSLKTLLGNSLNLDDQIFQPIVASPKPYHYRNRLDLKLFNTRRGQVFVGFTPVEKRGVLPVDACPIAAEEISDFIPELKRQAEARIPEQYRQANLVVRAGNEGKVFWGGIGRRSLQLQEEDYLWTEISGKKIFYSLDTFFQANLFILPKLFDELYGLDIWKPQTNFYDLYGGVGLFGIGLRERVQNVVLIEECPASLRLARYNVRFHDFNDFEVVVGKVEEELPLRLEAEENHYNVGMIDPPRAGLDKKALKFLSQTKKFNFLLYLSCNPEALTRDLAGFIECNWRIEKVMPFDFFPKTKHIETLVLLKKRR